MFLKTKKSSPKNSRVRAKSKKRENKKSRNKKGKIKTHNVKNLKNLKKKKELKVEKELTPEKIEKKEVSIEEKKEVQTILADACSRQLLIDLGGENTLEVIKCYPYNISDEEIARKLKAKISDIRSTLNKLHGAGIVLYNRKKDNDTGWYSYSWTLNKKKMFDWIGDIKRNKESTLDDGIERYWCKKCGAGSIVEFTCAATTSFKCPICNKDLEFLEREENEKLFGKYITSETKNRGTL